jgi:hypothetical protein
LSNTITLETKALTSRISKEGSDAARLRAIIAQVVALNT